MKTSEIRNEFLNYFKSHDHRVVESAPVILMHDPTLLFVNAGMVQFKDIFTGHRKSDYPTATSSQKCLRVGGKHNDLENVGRTIRHQTFFEMLGNFSFGDYFKEEAIVYAWTFLTKNLGLEEDYLWASVHHSDDEAFKIWENVIGLPKEKILKLGDEDNFWSMGDTGPCGPCSEIHFDLTRNGKVALPAGADEKLLELWNLVFMQYERFDNSEIADLPKPSIDTGMGLERIASAMDASFNNYETDILRNLIARAEKLSGVKYGDDLEKDVAMRVLADHSRAAAFLITESVTPGNEGRSYVLRRLIRRAVRYGKKIGIELHGFSKICAGVAEMMGDAYPELISSCDYFTEVVKEEEERFEKTLDRGLGLIEKKIKSAKESSEKALDAETVFMLYDTYGFPSDLSALIAEENGLIADTDGFESLMKKRKEESRVKVSFSQELDILLKQLYEEFGDTEFLGYETSSSEARVKAIIVDEQLVDEANSGQQVLAVFDQSPFYAESGGQVADTGNIKGSNISAEVLDVQKRIGSMFVHQLSITEGSLKKGEKVDLSLNDLKRRLTKSNHSATHLLHSGLRKVLGPHVRQAGSLVSDQRLRFDFNHFKALSNEEIESVERFVQDQINGDYEVITKVKKIDEAKEMGAMAIFEEKYGDTVRMIEIGPESLELCGGTHVRRSSEIQLFKIKSDSSVSSGTRRIEATTGRNAIAWLEERANSFDKICSMIGADEEGAISKVEELNSKLKDLQKEISRLGNKINSLEAEKQKDNKLNIEGIDFILLRPEDTSEIEVKKLKPYADELRNKIGTSVVVLCHKQGNTVLTACTTDLKDRFNAGKFLGYLRQELDGFRGGGKPDMAQGSAGSPENLTKLIDGFESYLRAFMQS